MSSVTFLIVAWMTLAAPSPADASCTAAAEHPFAGLVFLHDQAPDAREEARDAFDAFHAPRLHLLRAGP